MTDAARKAFEEWARSRYNLARLVGNSYYNAGYTNSAWEAWQAALTHIKTLMQSEELREAVGGIITANRVLRRPDYETAQAAITAMIKKLEEE